MSDDWVKNFIGVYKQRKEERQQEQRKARFAEEGALPIFEKLRERIKRDLEELHNAGLFPSLLLGSEIGPPQRFLVRQSVYPSAMLEAELRLITIDYRYIFKRDDTSKHEPGSQNSLRIYADLRGSVQIYNNGTPFSDESEVSELLLKPVLDYIDR